MPDHEHKLYWISGARHGCQRCWRQWERRGDEVYTRLFDENSAGADWELLDWEDVEKRPFPPEER